MDTRPNADRLDSLKQHRADLEAGTTARPVPAAIAAAEIRDLNREIATIERLARG